MSNYKRVAAKLRSVRAAMIVLSLMGAFSLSSSYAQPGPSLDLDPGARIEAKYGELGGASGLLGAALDQVRETFDGDGRYRAYENGFIYWHPSTGAHLVRGAIRARWGILGAEMGILGYPTSDEQAVPGNDCRVGHFQHGQIVWSQDTGMVWTEASEPDMAASSPGQKWAITAGPQ